MTDVPRRLRPSPEQRATTILTQTRGASSAQGATAAARPVPNPHRSRVYNPAAGSGATGKHGQFSVGNDAGDGWPGVMSVPLAPAVSIPDGFAFVQTAITLPTIATAGGVVASAGYVIPIPIVLWSVALVVVNQNCTQRLVVASTAAIDLTLVNVAEVISDAAFTVDATQTIGSDLAFGSGARIRSTAGGVFTSYLYVAVRAIDA